MKVAYIIETKYGFRIYGSKVLEDESLQTFFVSNVYHSDLIHAQNALKEMSNNYTILMNPIQANFWGIYKLSDLLKNNTIEIKNEWK